MNQINFTIIEGYIQSLMSCESKDDISHTLQSAASFLGFEYFAYGVKTTLPFQSPQIEMVNSYSKAWNHRYQQQGLCLIDPLIKIGMRGNQSILWDDVSDEREEFWQEAKANGIATGWSKPTHMAAGNSSLLSFSRGPSPISPKELHAQIPYLIWLTSIADEGFQKVLNIHQHNIDSELTPREVEVMKWSADGKTLHEIGVILSLSSRTVEFHVKNATKKLNAPNKMSAVVKAALLGLI